MLLQEVVAVPCVVCNANLPVFDRYPLVDGTFFLSTIRYNSDLQLTQDQRYFALFGRNSSFLSAVCGLNAGASGRGSVKIIICDFTAGSRVIGLNGIKLNLQNCSF